MDLQDQLKNLFPDAKPNEEKVEVTATGLWIPDDPVLCKYEKRNGKVVTIIDGYSGNDEDFKQLAKILKKKLGVGGGIKKEKIVIQGDYRDKIMAILKELEFKTKRVGG